MNNLENNKKIARFMGYVYYPSVTGQTNFDAGWKREPDASSVRKFNTMRYMIKPWIKADDVYLCRSHTQLKYDTDYNWLMKVCENILEEVNHASIEMVAFRGLNGLLLDDLRIHSVKVYAPRNYIYECVLEFIDWYNCYYDSLRTNE